jgi:hypothetical protein
MVKEFREFISRSNLVELAVAVILGLAFNAVVQSLVADVFTPITCEASAYNPHCLLTPRATFAALSDTTPKLGLEVVGATHFEPADPDGVDEPPDPERQRLFKRYTLAWLEVWLGCDGSALPYLDGRADEAAGTILVFDGSSAFPRDALPAGARC